MGSRPWLSTFLILEVHEVLDASFGLLAQALPQPDPVTQDLLLVASLVYLIDKAVPRQVAADRWTRELTVRLPVSEPDCGGAWPRVLRTAWRF